jgi:DNA-binding NarL/FixJ family response regulator
MPSHAVDGSPSSEGSAGPSSHPVRLRIAIIDDNAPIRLVLRKLLEAAAAVTVVGEGEDGDCAARVVVESEADVAIVDYHMPRVDGVEATRRIRAARPSVEIVAFTSTEDEAVAAAFVAAGASRHFDKLAIDELVAYVRSLTSLPQP